MNGSETGTFQDRHWWNAHRDGADAHNVLNGFVDSIRMSQAVRYDNWRKLIAMYEWGFKAGTYNVAGDVPVTDFTNAYNAAQNFVETVHSKIIKSKVIPMAITTGGGYMQRKRARDLQKALEGTFDENNLDLVKEDVVMDALTTGAGVAKVFCEWGKIRIQTVPIDDMLVDEQEGRMRCPPCIYQISRMDRFKALELYGGKGAELHGDQDERRRKILTAPVDREISRNANSGASYGVGSTDQIRVIEAWHLPSRPLSSYEGDEDDVKHDGRYVVAIEGCTLIDTEWCYDRFPFAFYIPRRRRRCFWGLALMQQLAAPQKEYEYITGKIQNSVHWMAGAHWLAPRGSKVDPRLIDNDEGTVWEFDGQTPPTAYHPEIFQPQALEYQQGITAQMAQHSGISTYASSAQVPAGLQQASGKALQAFDDTQDERLRAYHTELDRWFMDLSQLVIMWARELTEYGEKELTVGYAGQKALEKVDWAQVLLDESEYTLKIFPISDLSRNPSARFEQLQEMLQAGAITVEQFRRLFNLPDLESENELDSADTDVIDMALDAIVLKGKYISPEPFDNLQLAYARAGKFYNLCRLQDVPEARLQLLRNYILDVKARMDEMNGVQQAPIGGPVPPPGAPPPGGPGLPAPPPGQPADVMVPPMAA
jgi:hypothetical protein